MTSEAGEILKRDEFFASAINWGEGFTEGPAPRLRDQALGAHVKRNKTLWKLARGGSICPGLKVSSCRAVGVLRK